MLNRLSYVAIVLLLVACSKQSSEDHIIAAKEHISNNNYSAASIELKNAIKQSPDIAEARFLLGKVYLQQKDYQGAEKELNKALELNHPASEVVPLLSQAYQKTKSDLALLELSHRDKGFSTEQSAQVAFYKIQAMLRLAQKEQAKMLIDESQQLDTDSVFKQLSFVLSLVLNEQVEAAQLQLSDIIAAYPKQADAHKLNALLLAQSGDVEQASNAYLTYLSHYPEDLEITFITARLLTGINKTEQAEPLLDKLLAINESHGLLNQLKGIARFRANDMALALAYSEKAILALPTEPAIRLLAGYAAYQLKDFEKSHQHLSQIAQDLPADHEALRLLAASQLRLGLNNEASDTIAALDDIQDSDNSLISTVGLALMRSGEVEKARSILQKSDKLEASTAEDLTRIGLLKLSLNDVSGIAKLEQALDKQPEENFTRSTLATAYLSTNQFDKAHELAQKWKILDAADVQAYVLAGIAYTRQDKLEKASQEFEQALIIEPKNLPAHMAYADLLLTQEKIKSANDKLQKAIDIEPAHIPALAKLYMIKARQQDTESVVKHIEHQHNLDKDNLGLVLLLSKIYLEEKRPQLVVDLLSTFEMKDAPKLYWQTLGQAYFQQKLFNKLIKHYRLWLTEQPNDRDAVMSNLVLFDNQGKYQEALTASRNYVESNKGDMEVNLYHIHFLLLNGEVEQAKILLNEVPVRFKNIPFVMGLTGQLQMVDKDFAAALLNIKAAYKARPTARNVRLIQICFNNTGRQQEGLDFVKAHVASHPNDGASLMQLAQLQLASDVEGAIQSYEKALEINENNFVALNNLAYFYLEKNEIARALEYSEKALKIRPDNPDIMDTIARVYTVKKDYGTAVKYLSQAVNTGKVKEEIYLNYVEALVLNNELVLAKRKLEQRKFLLPQSRAKVDELKKALGI